MKVFRKTSNICNISAQNKDCGYSLEPLNRGGSNGYPQSMFFFAEIRKNNVYPCKPVFLYNYGFKGVKIIYNVDVFS